MKAKNFFTYFIFIFSAQICVAQNTALLSPNLFEISSNGDTINRTDQNGNRVGIWSEYQGSRFGDDAFYEVGKYSKNKKHGNWKTYAKNGILLKEANYYNNFLNGESKFYDQGQLICIGQYKALRTDYEFDTILVENPITNAFEERIFPTSMGSVRHGFWTFYKPPYNEIRKVQEYQADELIYEHEYVTKSDSLAIQRRLNKYPHISKKKTVGFWRRGKEKKPPLYTDFPIDTKHVTPNPGKKKAIKH